MTQQFTNGFFGMGRFARPATAPLFPVSVMDLALRARDRFARRLPAQPTRHLGVVAAPTAGLQPGNGLRWTDGDAALPWSQFGALDGPKEPVLHIGATTSYPILANAPSRAAA